MTSGSTRYPSPTELRVLPLNLNLSGLPPWVPRAACSGWPVVRGISAYIAQSEIVGAISFVDETRRR